jgi:23S rRNA (guanosine2251-2'-O)-methyltransferase
MIRERKQNNFEEIEGVIVGRNPIIEALKANRGIEKILVARGEREGSILKIIAMAKDAGIPIVDADKSTLNSLSQMNSHQGVAAYVALKEYCEVDDILEYAKSKNEKPFVVIVDGLTDPHNLGAIIRTANASGVHGIIIPKRRNVGMTASVYKASAGAAEYMKVARVSNIASTIEELKEKGLWIFGTEMEGNTYYFDADYNCACAIIIGGEDEGIGRLIKERCDYLIKIPMMGEVSSLNASAAGAVILYEVLKQRIIGG